jgi:hypothetical protein
MAIPLRRDPQIPAEKARAKYIAENLFFVLGRKPVGVFQSPFGLLDVIGKECTTL